MYSLKCHTNITRYYSFELCFSGTITHNYYFPENNRTIQKILKSFTKEILTEKILNKLNVEYQSSWKKDKLIKQVLSCPEETIIKSFRVKELKVGLTLLNLPITGKKETLCKRLKEGLQDKKNRPKAAKIPVF